MVLGPAAHLWSRTTLTPRDVDVALLYDGFSFNCLSWLEALGFCEHRRGAGRSSATAAASRSAASCRSTRTAASSRPGRTHGYGFLHEAIVQLRGDAGERQVPDAEVAVVSTGGGTPGGCLLLTRS